MPLPPRDLCALHLSLNPAFGGLHTRFPLSRYVPALGLFRLYQLAAVGSPVLALLNIPSWMTLACLDDMGADFCISQALIAAKASSWDRSFVNTALANAAAPFLVVMLLPVAMAKPPADTHVSPTAPSRGGSEASSRRGPEPPRRRAGGLDGLHPSVLRCAAAVIRDHGNEFKMRAFEDVAARLGRLSTAAACKAVMGLSERLDADADYSADSIRAKLHACVADFES